MATSRDWEEYIHKKNSGNKNPTSHINRKSPLPRRNTPPPPRGGDPGLHVGACCLPSTQCYVAHVSSCTANDGEYQGDGTVCSTYSCGYPSGACCLGGPPGSDGYPVCTMVADADTCAFAFSEPGTWLGHGSSCYYAGNPCQWMCPDDKTCVYIRAQDITNGTPSMGLPLPSYWAWPSYMDRDMIVRRQTIYPLDVAITKNNPKHNDWQFDVELSHIGGDASHDFGFDVLVDNTDYASCNGDITSPHYDVWNQNPNNFHPVYNINFNSQEGIPNGLGWDHWSSKKSLRLYFHEQPGPGPTDPVESTPEGMYRILQGRDPNAWFCQAYKELMNFEVKVYKIYPDGSRYLVTQDEVIHPETVLLQLLSGPNDCPSIECAGGYPCQPGIPNYTGIGRPCGGVKN